MAAWKTFASEAPNLAERVSSLFTAHKHHTMATLRVDGSPRISGTEVRFEGGELLLGMMAATRRAADLRRDPRVALHTHTVDPGEEQQELWPGDAKVAGRAVEVAPNARQPAGAEWFQIDVHDVVLTTLGLPADHLVIEAWTPRRGYASWRR